MQDHPYIECDPGPGSPPRSCTVLNPRQVTRVTTGNPELEPSGTARFAIGAEARRGPFFLNVEWYRLSRSDLSGHNSADWAMQNLDECVGDDKTNCNERTAGDITIRDRYANTVEAEVSASIPGSAGVTERALELSAFAESGGASTPPNCSSRAKKRTGTPSPGMACALVCWRGAGT